MKTLTAVLVPKLLKDEWALKISNEHLRRANCEFYGYRVCFPYQGGRSQTVSKKSASTAKSKIKTFN